MLAIGGIRAAMHRNDIRQPIVRPYAGVICDAFILMQDNTLARTVRVPMTYSTTAASSKNVQNLIDALIQELQAIPQKVIRSMPCRCYEYVNHRVGHTSYW